MDDPSKTTAQDKVYSQIFIEVYIFLWDFYKNHFVSKADRIDVKIGYPDYTYNDTYMNDLYKGVS
jgi:hypothetical protein